MVAQCAKFLCIPLASDNEVCIIVRMETNSRKIIKKLKADGFEKVSQRGSHVKLRHEDGRIVIVPHPKKDLPKGTAKSIAEMAGWL